MNNNHYIINPLSLPSLSSFIPLVIASSNRCSLAKADEILGLLDRIEDAGKVNGSNTGFRYMGIEYCVDDFVYVGPHNFDKDERGNETHKGGRNVGLKAYVICQLMNIESPKNLKVDNPNSVMVQVRRFFRPEDLSLDKAYRSDIRERKVKG